MSDPFGLLGQVLENRYRIDACVGEGGFGVVYRATHTTFDEPRAIKLLKVPSHFSGEVRASFVRRFVAEGKLIRKLAEVHTAVVGVDDFGAVMLRGEAVPYLALEWLEGQTLDAYVSSRGALAEAEALALLDPVLEALEKAHDGAAGQIIAHRDIKPENLFVTKGSDGRPRLRVLDFGIAKVMQEGDDAARKGTGLTSTFAAFSPVFGAPEQFLPDEHGATGPHTDVHAMGLVIGFALAGRSPYKGKSQGALTLEALSPKRPTPRALGANVSDALESVCAKALALMPGERYRTAGELGAALRAVAGRARTEAARPLPKPAPPPPAPPRGPDLGTMVDVRTFDPSQRAAPRRKTPTFPPPQPESASAGAPLGTQLNAGTFLGPSSAVVPPSEPARQPLPMSTIRLGVLGGVGFASVVLLGVFIVSQATTAPATTAATTSALTVTAAPTDSPSAKSAATEAAPNGTEEVGPDVPKPVASAPRPGPAAPTKPEPAAKPPTPVSPAADPGEFNRGAAAASLGGAAGGAKSCKTADGPKGSGRVKVTFNPTSGNVTSAIVEGQQFEGTSVGACVAAAFRGAHIPPFDGAPVAVSKSFTID